MGTREEKVHYTELLPHEFRKRLRAKPVAYLPLGTLEWHGPHLPLGSDSIQSEGLMVACARQLGGIVLPPLYLGPDQALIAEDGQTFYGMDALPDALPPQQLPGSCYWVSNGFFKVLVDMLLIQLKRTGFQGVFADGHGPSRWSWVKDIPEREARFGLKLFGVTSDITRKWKYQIDHAGQNETSIMLALRPDLVDLTKLPPDSSPPPERILGKDPRHATDKLGKQYLNATINILQAKFAKAGL
jgi:creatinine amidohydrolase